MGNEGNEGGAGISKGRSETFPAERRARPVSSFLFSLPYAFLVLAAAYVAYRGAFEAFSLKSWPDISSRLLSLAALLGGLFLFGVAAHSARGGQDGWAVVLPGGRRLWVRGLFVLGRGPLADLGNPSLLERHARLFLRGQELLLEDLAQRGDVLVNGAVLSGGPAPLSPGDRVEIGALRFRVER